MSKSKEFISTSESDSDAEPKPKKKKPSEKKVEKREEKSKAGASSGPEEHSFQLAKNRFVTVSEFRGKVLVGIREFYESDGQMKPGKKGISLSVDQWKKLKEQVDDIDEAVKKVS
ncbi:hypothetical protein CHS0354_013720 [Potamilus streckersoni]|uniref:Transcriptional coactivator p15 (PC4) C-terminal domain-containing protein n=1 Tax=Potamilus streckersoni TaxID=2493646 RepID=A0AAE0TFW0_9BIVA|nr:hypothetical protein CHS0354_013720 [Potamilus streckersoni]